MTYELTENNGNCQLLRTGQGWILKAEVVSAECTVTARQAGDGQYAPAVPVSRDYRVGFQLVSLEWVDPPSVLTYRTTDSSAELRIRVRSPSALDGMAVSANASGACTDGPGGSASGPVPLIVTVSVTLTDPGDGDATCTVVPSASSSTISYSTNPPSQTFIVRRG